MEELVAKYNAEVASLVHRVLTLQVELEAAQRRVVELEARVAENDKEDEGE